MKEKHQLRSVNLSLDIAAQARLPNRTWNLHFIRLFSRLPVFTLVHYHVSASQHVVGSYARKGEGRREYHTGNTSLVRLDRLRSIGK